MPDAPLQAWKLFWMIWTKGIIPSSWKRAEGCFVPKETYSSNISQFIIISVLLNARYSFLSWQKGWLPRWWRTNMWIHQSRRAAFQISPGAWNIRASSTREESKGNLMVAWLDLANAYGSIPHGLINAAMEQYHIPQHIRGMITSYFVGFKLQFNTAHFTTQWQDLEKVIPMTMVEGVKKWVNKHLCKWLGIPPSFTSVGLYIRSGQLQLPSSLVVEEFKVGKCRAVMMYKDWWKGQKCRRHYKIMTQMGSWHISGTSWKYAEAEGHHQEPMCREAMTWIFQWGKADPRQRRDMSQAEVRHLEEERRRSRAVELGSQGVGQSGTCWNRRSRGLRSGDSSPFASLSCSARCTNKPPQMGNEGGPVV